MASDLSYFQNIVQLGPARLQLSLDCAKPPHVLRIKVELPHEQQTFYHRMELASQSETLDRPKPESPPSDSMPLSTLARPKPESLFSDSMPLSALARANPERLLSDSMPLTDLARPKPESPASDSVPLTALVRPKPESPPSFKNLLPVSGTSRECLDGIVPALTIRKALCEQCSLHPDTFDTRFDRVYDNSLATTKRRGGEHYLIPTSGWQKLGVRVDQKYEDPEWLSKNEWPVAYHGTSASSVVRSILHDGFKIKGGQFHGRHGDKFGVGIYCSPVLEKAMMYAEEPLMVDGAPYTLIFQCRVRPSAYTKPSRDVWLVRDGNDIRPCGLLFRKSLLTDEREIRYSDKHHLFATLRNARTVKEARSLGRSYGALHKDLYKGHLHIVGTNCRVMTEAYRKARETAGQFACRDKRKRKMRMKRMTEKKEKKEKGEKKEKRDKKEKKDKQWKGEKKEKRDKKDKKHSSKKEKKQSSIDSKEAETFWDELFAEDEADNAEKAQQIAVSQV